MSSDSEQGSFQKTEAAFAITGIQWARFHCPWEAALSLWLNTGNATSAFAYTHIV